MFWCCIKTIANGLVSLCGVFVSLQQLCIPLFHLHLFLSLINTLGYSNLNRSLINVFYHIERARIFAVFRIHDFRSTYNIVSRRRKLEITNSLNISINMMRKSSTFFLCVGMNYIVGLNDNFIMLSSLCAVFFSFQSIPLQHYV